jgi:ribosomal protein S18 acetylase RimI-like enzyme
MTTDTSLPVSRASQIITRPARLEDAEQIANVGAKVFEKTFSFQTTPEQMASYLSSAYTPEAIRKVVADSHYSYMVAEAHGGGPILGFVSTTDTPPDSAYDCLKPYPDLVEINRLYVDTTHHGGGVGQTLLDAALRDAKAGGRKSVWLGVYPENPRAIRFYAKNGFQKVGDHEFKWEGGQIDRDDVMVKTL